MQENLQVQRLSPIQHQLEDIANVDQSEDVAGVEQLEDEDDILELEDANDEEDIYDPDLYEIYEDEQGQIYYIKRNPVETEIEESVNQEEDSQDKKEVSKKEAAKKPAYSAKELRLLQASLF